MVRNGTFDLLHQPGPCDTEQAARLQKASQIVQIQIIGPVVDERIDAHDRVEELRGERQRSRIRVDRKHAIVDVGIPHALKVVRGTEPQVGGPHLDPEFATEKDRRHRQPAAEVQHPHVGPQVERLGEPLGEPQRVGPAAGAGDDPFGMVFRRARESLRHQSLVCGHGDFTGLLATSLPTRQRQSIWAVQQHRRRLCCRVRARLLMPNRRALVRSGHSFQESVLNKHAILLHGPLTTVEN